MRIPLSLRSVMASVMLASLFACGGGGSGGGDSPSPPASSGPVTPPSAASSCTQVSQYGVTFTFDDSYPCGTFANGDYWVTPKSGGATVRITAITPASTGTRNGFEVNPGSVEEHGFDSRSAGFNSALGRTLPYTAHAGESVVKAVSLASSPSGKTYLDTAVVLTVLAAVPADNGATVFRPPYFGTAKPMRSTASIRMSALPRLAAPSGGGVPTLADITARFKRVQLDHLRYWSGDQIHPVQNMPDYGAAIASDTADAALRLMLDDSTADKLPAAVAFLQYGIDLAAAIHGGQHFEADGGHRHGRKLVLAMAAALLDDADIRALVHDAPGDRYQEDGDLYFSAHAGQVLWGKACSTADYWDNQITGNNSRDCRDPYGYIDGGQEPGGYYQFCCTSKQFAATALALRLMPSLQCIWNNPDILAYADRWVTFGTWTQPDPYAPMGNGALDANPGNGTGRWPALHGTGRNDGYYSSGFADAMWTRHRASAVSPSC